MSRPVRPSKNQTWKGPQLPTRLLRDFALVETTKEFNQEKGGFYAPIRKEVVKFKGTLMPLDDSDIERLPEGTSVVDSQKIYTNGKVLVIGQIVKDSHNDREYSIVTDLDHNVIHGMKRYVVTIQRKSAYGK